MRTSSFLFTALALAAVPAALAAGPNPDCPDADGDGVCNGRDADYTPTGGGPHGRFRRMTKRAESAVRGVISTR